MSGSNPTPHAAQPSDAVMSNDRAVVVRGKRQTRSAPCSTQSLSTAALAGGGEAGHPAPPVEPGNPAAAAAVRFAAPVAPVSPAAPREPTAPAAPARTEPRRACRHLP